MIRLPPREWGLVAAAGAVLIDQASKIAILYGMGLIGAFLADDTVSRPLLPFFNLTIHSNYGVSFGLFAANGPLGTGILVVLSLAATLFLGRWLWSSTRLALAVGLGLCIGGALGNLVDRMIYGKVADFFDFHTGGYHWYVFNLADCAITLGVAALVYDTFFRPGTGDANGQAGESNERQ